MSTIHETIDDAVLANFLRTDAEAPALIDPGGIVPERWRSMGPQLRREWFLHIFSTVLEGAAPDRRPLVLVAEPSVAGLFFYGVRRLLPPGVLCDGIACSTSEADPDQAAALLSATWPADGQGTAWSEGYPWQRPTINTLVAREGQKPAPVSPYVESIVQRFLESFDTGCGTLDQDLKAMAAVPIAAAKDLDIVIEIDRAADALFAQGAFSPGAWRNSAPAIEYFRQKVAQRLTGSEDVATVLKAIVGGQAHLAVIDLLSGKSPPQGSRRAVVHLLQELPAEKILNLLKLPSVADDDKLTVLLRHIYAHGTLPPGCEFLLDEWAEAAEQPRRAGVVLMARVLARLPSKAMARFYASVPKRCVDGFLKNSLKLVQQKKMKLPTLTAMIRAAEGESVFKLIRAGGEQFLANYPKNEPALGEKLVDLLRTLAQHPDDFKERLDLILAGQHLLGEEVYLTAAASWDKVYKSILEVGRLQRPDASMSTEKRHAFLVTSCRDMAMAADRAMTLETMDAEYTWSQKRDFLTKIAQGVLGGTPLLVPGAWETEILSQRIDSQFQHHRFSTDPLKRAVAEKKRKEEEKKEKIIAKKAAAAESKPLVKTSKGLMVGMIVLLALITIGVLWGAYYLFTRPSGPRVPKKRGPRDRLRQRSTMDQERQPGASPNREADGESPASGPSRGQETNATTSPLSHAERGPTSAPLSRLGNGAGGEGTLVAAVLAGVPGLVRQRLLQ